MFVQAVQDRNEGGKLCANSGAYQSQGGEWKGDSEHGGEMEDPETFETVVQGCIDVTLETDPRLGAVLDQGWNITTS